MAMALHNPDVIISIGAFLNAIGILLGAGFGLARRKPISLQTQIVCRNGLGALTVLCGLWLVYQSVGGTFLAVLKQTFLALVAIVPGFWIGKLLRFQKFSNRLGRMAAGSIAAATQKNSPQNAAEGFNACTILFCAAPLGLIGAITDGLAGYFYLLAVKAGMDALAMVSFVKMFRWPSAACTIPVFIIFSGISLATQVYARPFLDSHGLTDSVNATAGFVVCIIAVVIFEVRKVELANYLPALVVAPFLAWLFGH